MHELVALKNGGNCATNQVLYNLEQRGIEFDLVPWQREHKIPIMAYSPVGHGRRLLENAALKKIAERNGATTAQIALAYLLRQPNMIAIPKASNPAHVRDNARAIDVQLKDVDLQDIDREFPRPKSRQPLGLL
jgi:diketogulonate reductase-like aldo/keto reductase